MKLQKVNNFFAFKLLYIFFILSYNVAFAQNSIPEVNECSIGRLEEEFNNSPTRVIIRGIMFCMSEFEKNPDFQSRAYSLLARAFSEISLPDSVDKYFIKFMELNTAINPIYLAEELQEVWPEFQTTSRLFLRPKVGINSSYRFPYKKFSTDKVNTINDNKPKYAVILPVPSWQVGIDVDYILSEKVDIGIGLSLGNNRYLYKDGTLNTTEYKNHQNFNLKLKEGQTFVEVPIWLRYNFADWANRELIKDRPNKVWFIQVGLSGRYLLGANIVGVERNLDNPIVNDARISLMKVETVNGKVNLRRRRHVSVNIGGGIHWHPKDALGYLTIEANMALLPLNQVRKENRYAHSELLFTYGYVDDDFGMANLSLSAGYTFNWKQVFKTYTPKRMIGEDAKEKKLKKANEQIEKKRLMINSLLNVKNK